MKKIYENQMNCFSFDTFIIGWKYELRVMAI